MSSRGCSSRASTAITRCSANARARPSVISRRATGSRSATSPAIASTSTIAASPRRSSASSVNSASPTPTAATTRSGQQVKRHFIGLLVDHRAARVRRDVLQLRVVEDCCTGRISTTGACSSARRSRPSTSTPTRRRIAAITRCSTACAHALIDLVLDLELERALRRFPRRPDPRARGVARAACRGRSSSTRITRSRCCRACSSATRPPTSSAASSTARTRIRSSRRSSTTQRRAAVRRRAADRPRRARAAVLGQSRVLPRRHGSAVRLRRLPAHDACRTRPRPSSTRCSACRSTGKTLFFRDFLHHLKHSTDRFVVAPGHPGSRDVRVHAALVPVRVQGDPRPDCAERRTPIAARVKQKYALVKHHDRAGRMTDILEYSNVAFPRDRFTDELIAELEAVDPSQLELDGDHVIVRHLYIERRLTPLNLFLERRRRRQRDARDARLRQRDQGARRDQHLRRRPAVQEFRRHALRPCRVLRLRRDRIPDRLPLPHDPAAAGRLSTRCRTKSGIRSDRTTCFPRNSRRSC